MLAINGHFKNQPVTGVQRYAREILRVFEETGPSYTWIDPPERLTSDALRQLWMQAVMPGRVPEDALLWSPTNTGPVRCSRQVLTLHDLADQLHPEWFSRRYTAWRSLILPPLLRRVRAIITISDYSRQTILERYPYTEGKISVIPNGVNSRWFYPREPGEVERTKRKLGIEKDYVVTVGSLDPRKNLDRLVAAWQRLPERHRDDCELVIAGAGSDKFSYRLDRRAGDSVRFTGYVANEDLPALYSGARLFVYPSLFEGFGLPVLEAMSCRVPVLTSDTTALAEIANGAALKVNPERTGDIADGMQRLLESTELRRELGERGRSLARLFRWEQTARQTLEVLKAHAP